MPELSRFYGIIIYMFWKDHAPPHFHAEYGDNEALILIGTWEIYRGALPARALKLVREWAELHKEEIRQQWAEAVASQPLKKIDPLP
jgi:hypothetical protein